MECREYPIVVTIHLGIKLIQTGQGFLAQHPHDAMALLCKQVLQAVGLFAKEAMHCQNRLGCTGLLDRIKDIVAHLAILSPSTKGANTAMEIPSAQMQDGKHQMVT